MRKNTKKHHLHKQKSAISWRGTVPLSIDREFVTSAKKNSRILTNFPKLKKFVKIRKKIR